MNLTSEQIHWSGGIAFTAVALLLLLRETQVLHWRWIDWSLPALLVAYGLESFVDLWVHGDAVPDAYGAERTQHLLQGYLVSAAGVVEALRVAGRLRHAAWGGVLPGALAAVATVFLLHAQHGDPAGSAAMLAQHRAFAVALYVSAIARVIAVVPSAHTRGFRVAWLLPLLIFGIEMMTYTEAGAGVHTGH